MGASISWGRWWGVVEEITKGRQRKPRRGPKVTVGAFVDFSPPQIGSKVFVHAMGREICVPTYP